MQIKIQNKISEWLDCRKKASEKNKRINNDINHEELEKIIKQNNNVVLLDVRSNQEYREYNLNGSINIPLDMLEENITKKITQKKTLIIVYCQYGLRSKKAYNILQRLGYTNIYNLKNGISHFK